MLPGALQKYKIGQCSRSDQRIHDLRAQPSRALSSRSFNVKQRSWSDRNWLNWYGVMDSYPWRGISSIPLFTHANSMNIALSDVFICSSKSSFRWGLLRLHRRHLILTTLYFAMHKRAARFWTLRSWDHCVKNQAAFSRAVDCEGFKIVSNLWKSILHWWYPPNACKKRV